MMFSTYAFTTSLVCPYFLARMFFARSYPSTEKGKPSISARIFGSTSSFRYEYFVTPAISALSISVSN